MPAPSFGTWSGRCTVMPLAGGPADPGSLRRGANELRRSDMRPRTEALLAVLALATVAAVAALLGRSSGGVPDTDWRPSTFLAGPEGARALLEAAQRLGIEVRRFRERPAGLTSLEDRTRQMLIILDPTVLFSPPERSPVLQFGRQADLLLAGPGAEPLMRCFGYRLEW